VGFGELIGNGISHNGHNGHNGKSEALTTENTESTEKGMEISHNEHNGHDGKRKSGTGLTTENTEKGDTMENGNRFRESENRLPSPGDGFLPGFRFAATQPTPLWRGRMNGFRFNHGEHGEHGENLERYSGSPGVGDDDVNGNGMTLVRLTN
jgi:hypothetical protein